MSYVPYASAVGSLMNSMLCTWLDIYFVICLVSHCQSNLGPIHWQAVKRIFHYLHGTSDMILCHQNGDHLRGYSDVDWGSNPDESRSTSEFVYTLDGGATSCCSLRKKDCITLSTMKAQYVACYLATQEAIWLKSFLRDFNLTPRVDDHVELMCGNTDTI